MTDALLNASDGQPIKVNGRHPERGPDGNWLAYPFRSGDPLHHANVGQIYLDTIDRHELPAVERQLAKLAANAPVAILPSDVKTFVVEAAKMAVAKKRGFFKRLVPGFPLLQTIWLIFQALMLAWKMWPRETEAAMSGSQIPQLTNGELIADQFDPDLVEAFETLLGRSING